jgi:hypothetical protein
VTDERRISDRANLKQDTVTVYDRNRETMVGTIANISETGFMLVSTEEIQPESVFQFELQFSDRDINVQLGAVCLWNAEAGKAGVFWNGFHIIDISDQAQSQLQQVMQALLSAS